MVAGQGLTRGTLQLMPCSGYLAVYLNNESSGVQDVGDWHKLFRRVLESVMVSKLWEGYSFMIRMRVLLRNL